MPLKDLARLRAEIDQAVHTNGPLGRTTASGLNQVLLSLATELTTLPQALRGETLRTLDYAQVMRQQQAGELQPGAYYLIGNRPGPGLSSSGRVLAQAVAADALAREAVLCTRVPDYERPLWRTNFFEQGPATGTTYELTESPFTGIVPQETDFVDYRLDGDDKVVVAQLPFAFEFGGVSYAEVAVDSNGRLVFDPAYFRSEYNQQALAPGYASVYLCWGDLIVSPGTVRYFTTGQAPYRKFIVDYQDTIPQTGYPAFSFSGIFSGQIVLEETTNVVTLGFSANTLTETTWVQGLRYPQQAYQIDQNRALRSGVLHRFAPITSRGAVVPALAASPVVRWLGSTWQLAPAGDARQEPGTGAAWVPATGAGADAFGNSVPCYDAVRYDLATDTISQRRDKQGNVLRDSSLAGFPWGHPGVRGNLLRAVVLDNSLHYVEGLWFCDNTLERVRLEAVALAGVPFARNRLTDVQLRHYAPRTFEDVEATQGLDPGFTNCAGRRFWQGQLVEEPAQVARELLGNVLHRQSQVNCVVYRNGQPTSYRLPDFTHPVGSVMPAHDRIDLVGDWTTKTLFLRNYDFTINGNGVVARDVAIGRGSTGMRVAISDLTVTDYLDFNVTSPLLTSLNLNPGAAPTAGMNVTLTRCNINRLALAGVNSAAGVGINRYSVDYCTIRRIERTGAASGTVHRFAHCVFGQGLAEGSVFGGSGPATASALVIANSVIKLAGTATLYDNNTPPAQLPTFENVTLLAADGTVSRLDTRPLALAATAAGLEVLATATLRGDLGSGGFYTVPLSGTGLDVRPAGTAGGWDQAASAYVAPLSGTYELAAKVRLHDDSGPVGSNYALGTGPSNQDGEWVSWNTIWQTNGTNRKGHQHTCLLHLSAGEAVHTYMYLDGFGGTIWGEMSVKLLRRD
ncbi:MAG TPA: hypothetical protein VFO93_11580 [Hymenobacter sp.]|uniref:hypothetical protein n=1 Tax=Hymenobacter sp. TaxID=1898978 RepID=UPI002D7EEA69|nr:hypothetical protein [Hymenobacter sp.]HET9504174.1 hypothetical protein [Hymenobacter sp.]